MTQLLEQALETVRRLSSEHQDEIASAMLALAGRDRELEAIDIEHLPDLLISLAQAQ